MRARSLRNRVTVWFTGTVITTVACVLLILHLRIQEETTSQVAREMERASAVFASQQSARAENVLAVANLLGDSPRLAAAVAGTHADPATVTDVVADLRRRFVKWDLLIVTDAIGTIVGDSRMPAAIGRDDRHEESVRAALHGEKWTGSIVQDRHIYQLASAPIYVGGAILGTVRVGHEINDSVAQKLEAVTESEVSFFTGGKMVASSLTRPQQLEVLDQLAGDAALASRVERGEPFMLHLGKQQYLSLAKPLSEGSRDSVYLIQESLDDALRPYRTIQQFLLGIGVLGLLCAVIVSYAVAAGIADPLLRIVGAAEALGRGDWSQRVDASSADEVGVLAATFNTMAAKLESWDADLRGAVAERTAELRATVSRLDAAFDQMRRFNADASHELRTPLTIVRGEAEVALRSPRSSDEYQRVLNSILEETERMGRIVENLLLLARADSGEVMLERTRVALDDILMDLQHPAGVLGRRSGIDLTFQVSDRLFVRGDALRLHQLFLNLLDNATKYTPAGGAVWVSAAQEGDRVVVRVADTGIGIEEKDLPHLFERFFRVDKARSRELGGSGLGLSICRWIVDAHRGGISVSSTPGEGSVFTVWLPAEPRAPELSAEHSSGDRAGLERSNEKLTAG